MLFFSLDAGLLALVLTAFIFGGTGLGLLIGRRLRARGDTHREPLAVLQASMLGVVGLVLAFGLALAVGRYETRRSAIVEEANAISTTYLRAQTLDEPMRSQSMALLKTYADTEIELARAVPSSPAETTAAAAGSRLQQQLWTLAGQVLADDPNGNASRLYVESLNDMASEQSQHLAAYHNRVPSPVLLLELLGAAAALCLLATYLSILGRGILPVLLGAALVTSLLYVTFDLDRPTRGLINVEPTALIQERATMDLPPAVGPR